MRIKLGVVGGLAALAFAACSDDGGSGTPPPPPGGGARPPNLGLANQDDGNNAGNVGGSQQTAADPQQGAGGSAGVNEGADNVNGGIAGGAMVGNAGSGNMGAGGAAMPGGEIGVGEGLQLIPNAEGWVAGATNGVGIQGGFYGYSDSDDGAAGTSSIDSVTFDPAAGSACVSGVAGQVEDVTGDGALDYNVIWGGGLGLALGDLGAMMGTVPWEPEGVTGFTFTLSGTLPPELRFNVTMPGGVSGCFRIDGPIGPTAPGLKTVSFAQVQQRCWNDPANPPAALPVGGFDAIQWQVASNADAAVPFDFCVENLTAVQ